MSSGKSGLVTVPFGTPLPLGVGGFGIGTDNDVSMESIVRPFVPLAPRWPTPVTQGPNETAEEPEAYLEWGTQGDFESDARDTPVEDLDADGYANPSYPGVGYVGNGPNGGEPYDPGDPEKPSNALDVGELVERMLKTAQDNAKGVHDYDEIDRSVQRTKIWDPNDNSNWMIIERVTTIRFRGPMGQIVKFNLRPPPMMRKPDTGGSEEA